MQQSKSLCAFATGTGAACAVGPAQESHGGSHLPADEHTCPAKLALARLLIHATGGAVEGGGALPRFLGRLRNWATATTRRGVPPAVGLRVADLQGRQFFSADTLTPVIDVPLPAGTYHVSVSHGGQERRYTVALEQGAHFRPALARDDGPPLNGPMSGVSCEASDCNTGNAGAGQHG